MRIHQITSNDEGETNPKRSTLGCTLAIRWGDVCHPLGTGDWFNPPYFSRVLRFYSHFPLPWVTWNLWGWRGYCGAKIYGADNEAYKQWMKPEDVYDGSLALHFSIRLTIKD